MKRFVGLTLLLAGVFVVGCNKSGGGKNSIQTLANKVSHKGQECPQNLSGQFCKDDGQFCMDISAEMDGEGALTLERHGEDSGILVNGKIQHISEEGDDFQVLGYCSANVIYVKTHSKKGDFEINITLSEDGQIFTEKIFGNYEGESIDITRELVRK